MAFNRSSGSKVFFILKLFLFQGCIVQVSCPLSSSLLAMNCSFRKTGEKNTDYGFSYLLKDYFQSVLCSLSTLMFISLSQWNAHWCYLLWTTYLTFEAFQILFPTATLIFTAVKLFHHSSDMRKTEHKASHPLWQLARKLGIYLLQEVAKYYIKLWCLTWNKTKT